MNCASTALASMPMTLIFPVLEWIVTVIVLFYWIIVMWFLASAGEFNPLTKQYEWNDQLQGLMIYHVFGLLWTRAWILAIGQLCIAGACADWFLATEKNLVGLAVFKSLGRSLRFHTGTAAFGSFLIAVVQMIRLAFRYYMWQISRYACLQLLPIYSNFQSVPPPVAPICMYTPFLCIARPSPTCLIS